MAILQKNVNKNVIESEIASKYIYARTQVLCILCESLAQFHTLVQSINSKVTN